jgi:DNA-binding HxlR family transcriptional regulator
MQKINPDKGSEVIRGKMIQNRAKNQVAGLESAVNIIGGKWRSKIIWIIGSVTIRFGQLHNLLHGMSKKVLSQQLRELERTGIVKRTIYAQIPSRVEYSLTEKGIELLSILEVLSIWGIENIMNEKIKNEPHQLI